MRENNDKDDVMSGQRFFDAGTVWLLNSNVDSAIDI